MSTLRLNKLLSQAGVASRRLADELIAQGQPLASGYRRTFTVTPANTRPLDPNAWRALFRSPRASGLTFLGLSGCHVGAVIATQLAAAPRLANLTDLDLSYNDIGVFGARALLDSPHLLKLRRLWLEGNFRARADGEDALAADLELRLGPGLHLHDSPADDEEEL